MLIFKHVGVPNFARKHFLRETMTYSKPGCRRQQSQRFIWNNYIYTSLLLSYDTKQTPRTPVRLAQLQLIQICTNNGNENTISSTLSIFYWIPYWIYLIPANQEVAASCLFIPKLLAFLNFSQGEIQSN